MTGNFARVMVAVLCAFAVGRAEAAPIAVQSPAEALVQDAREYARQKDVPLDEAMRRLRAQEETVAATDRLREVYRDRLAGIAIEHRPDYRIVVLLTGPEPVPDASVSAGGMQVPLVFRTGARATHAEMLAAILKHQAAIRAALPNPPGLGVDQKTGELVLVLRSTDAEAYGLASLDADMEALTNVPVRVVALDREETDLGIEGGSRVEGIDPANGRRYACTTGFVVTDGSRNGIVTAAHCPDALTYRDTDGSETELEFIGQWGARYRDVQVHVGGSPSEPLFYADNRKRETRRLTTWRNRASTRAGDVVCRRGETTGYSCSEVELVDYAPPGDLCGGPCDPTWVTVTGPACKAGDSGGPVFNGTAAFGIVKGGSYNRNGTCNFYYYMSTDYLPPGWSLLYR